MIVERRAWGDKRKLGEGEGEGETQEEPGGLLTVSQRHAGVIDIGRDG